MFLKEDESDKDKELSTKVHNVLNNIQDAAAIITDPAAAAADTGPSMT